MDKKKNCIAVTPDVINDIAISDDNNGQKKYQPRHKPAFRYLPVQE